LRVYRKAADVRNIHRTYDCRRSRTELWKKKVTVGCTSKIQPLGVRINKDFKKTSSGWATSNGQCPAKGQKNASNQPKKEESTEWENPTSI